MTSWLNKIYASMHSVVDNVHSVYLVFGFKICIEALFDIFNDGSPRIIVVDEITEARSVNYGKP